MPPLFISWEFRPPGIVEGRPYSEGIGSPVFRFINLSRFVENEKPFAGTIEVATDPFNNMRLAAKIAHGLFYFQEIKREGYLPLLGDVIRTGQFAPYFVGGPPKNEEVEIPDRDGVKPLHNTSFFEVTLHGDNVHTYLIARVSIFVPFGGPVLDVVTARKVKPIANCLAYPYAHPIPASDGTEIERHPAVLRAMVRSGPSVTG